MTHSCSWFIERRRWCFQQIIKPAYALRLIVRNIRSVFLLCKIRKVFIAVFLTSTSIAGTVGCGLIYRANIVYNVITEKGGVMWRERPFQRTAVCWRKNSMLTSVGWCSKDFVLMYSKEWSYRNTWLSGLFLVVTRAFKVILVTKDKVILLHFENMGHSFDSQSSLKCCSDTSIFLFYQYSSCVIPFKYPF